MKHYKYKTIAASSMLLYLLAGTGLRAQQAPSGSSDAQSAPRTLSYQGVLINTGNPGTKATGSRLLTVTLYSDANGNNKLWQSTMNTQVDSSGVFNCTLGTAENPLPAPSVMDRPIWLGVAISGGAELRPLSQVTASAYALNVVDNAITTAKLADGAVTSAKITDSSITTAKLANGSVTWNKMGTDYVPYIRVNGAKVNTGQNSINFTGGDGLKVDYDSNSMSVIIHPDSAMTVAGTGKGAHPLFIGGDPTSSNSDNGVPGTGSHAGSTNTVGGGTNNNAFSGVVGDLLGHATVSGGQSNNAKDTFATIGGGDTNTASGYESTIGGGTFNTVTNRDGFIGGGLHNTNISRYSAMAGGDANFVDDSTDASFLGGGLANRIGFYGNYSTVGDTTYIGANVLAGGRNNFVKSVTAALVGGLNNTIDTTENNAFIGAGANNLITRENSNIEGQSSAIVAGDSNIITGSNSFIGAGFEDTVALGYGGIIAGDHNLDSGIYAVIGGGLQNSINGRNSINNNGGESFIGAGIFNTISNETSFIGAGSSDTVIALGSAAVAGHNATIHVTSNYAFIGAGSSNTIDTASPNSAITGGVSNLLWGSTSNIAGGDTNTIYADSHTAYADNISGGQGNIIRASDTSAIGGGINNAIWYSPSAFIGGGSEGFIDGVTNATIAGGLGNIIGNPSAEEGDYGFIGGGRNNAISSNFDVIGGGDTNFIDNFDFSSIAGGQQNHITLTDTTSGDHSFIGGGLQNTILSGMSVIGGGDHNLNMGAAPFAVIPGGDSLIANSFAQTVIGYNNIQSGTFVEGTKHTFVGGGVTTDLPLFIIGNGDGRGVNPRSNAFEISYDGHSIVHDKLDKSTVAIPRIPVYGGTYNDNIVYAWGDVPGQIGGPYPSSDPPTADFGVQPGAFAITHQANGVYIVTVNLGNPLTQASITATGEDNTPIDGPNPPPGCIEITCSEIGHPAANQFIVRTYNNCVLTDEAFFFKVCGRQ